MPVCTRAPRQGPRNSACARAAVYACPSLHRAPPPPCTAPNGEPGFASGGNLRVRPERRAGHDGPGGLRPATELRVPRVHCPGGGQRRQGCPAEERLGVGLRAALRAAAPAAGRLWPSPSPTVELVPGGRWPHWHRSPRGASPRGWHWQSNSSARRSVELLLPLRCESSHRRRGLPPCRFAGLE